MGARIEIAAKTDHESFEQSVGHAHLPFTTDKGRYLAGFGQISDGDDG